MKNGYYLEQKIKRDIYMKTNEKIRVEVVRMLYVYNLNLETDFSTYSEKAKANYIDCKKYLDKINHLIQKTLFGGYDITRLSHLDRAICQYATYEMLVLGIDKRIAINEAIELTKLLSDLDDEKQHKFTNKLLDNIAKEIYDTRE